VFPAHTGAVTVPASGLLVFDGGCGFCTRALGWVRLLDREARLTTLPLQGPGVPERVGATRQACEESLHFAADGRVRTGAAAVAGALSVALQRELPERLYARTATVQERGYAWVARHRGRFPGITPWCARYPDTCS
jgi:predicted DCC family thiol-disulfide oxidoreductase YuxK